MLGVKTLAATAAAEPEFLLAVQRGMRTARDRIAILVHLSRLREARAALPPPHQLHVARSILQEAAQRFEGQLFSLRNGDLALLCRAHLPTGSSPPRTVFPGNGGSGQSTAGNGPPGPGLPGKAGAFEPTALPGILARLFHADMARLISLWPLATEGEALLRYAADRLAETPIRPLPPPARPAAPIPGQVARVEASHPAAEPGALTVIDGVSALLAGSRVAELMHRQTAIRLRPEDPDDCGDAVDEGVPPPTHRLQAVFRELTFSVAALESRVARFGGRGLARADPFLFRYLAGRLDARMLSLLLAEAGSARLLDFAAPPPDDAAWHINLTLPAVLSDAFNRLVEIGRDAPLGIEIAYMEAVADPANFSRARQILAAAEVGLALDGIDEMGLRLTRPWRLMPDLIKLDWSPRLASDSGAEATDEAITDALERMGPGAVVLQKADTADALSWGLARGIELFQGEAVNALLAERRMAHCPLAPGCTLRQCIGRAAAVGPAGRSGCGDPDRLDDTHEDPVRLDSAWPDGLEPESGSVDVSLPVGAGRDGIRPDGVRPAARAATR